MAMSSEDRETLTLVNHYLRQARSNTGSGRSAILIISDAYGNIVRDRNQPGATNRIITAADHYFVSRNLVGAGNLRQALREVYGINVPVDSLNEAAMATLLIGGYDVVKILARAVDDSNNYLFNVLPFWEPSLRSNPAIPTSVPTALAFRWSLIGVQHGMLDHDHPNRPVNDLRPW